MKKELLVPVGNMNAMYQAINNGADAIYLAGANYGARNGAGFTNEELIAIVKYAHFFQVKVHITVNTLILDKEFNDVLKYIVFLNSIGVDALIMQDIGLINLVHHRYPELIIHASTQMHNLNAYSCVFLNNLGCKRVVLARELSLKEINNLKTNLELEAFIHGALCISYSGECLFSSLVLDRSGNRGLCAQVCRMPYELYINDVKQDRDGKYLLSPKDLCTVPKFEEIMQSNLTSLKIEGRLKTPEYVGLVTKIYRKLIDAYYENKKVDVNADLNKLKSLFNRGFTLGNLFSEPNIMNTVRGNHQGIKLGEVIRVNSKYIEILLCNDLRIKDGIKFVSNDLGMTVYNMYKDHLQVKIGYAGDIITLENKIHLKDKDMIVKTYDDELVSSLSKYEQRKVPVNIYLKAKINDNIIVLVNDGINEVSIKGSIIEIANKTNLSEEEIKEKLCKVGNTFYSVNKIELSVDYNAFIRLSELNELRRNALQKLSNIRETNVSFSKCEYEPIIKPMNNYFGYSAYVRNELQLKVCLNKVERIYTDDYNLYVKYKNKCQIYYEVNINNDMDLTNEKLLVNSTSDFQKYKDQEIILNYGLNIYNSFTLHYFDNYLCCLSPELKTNDLNQLVKPSNSELLVYGKVRIMTMKHCLITDLNICNKCGKCHNKIMLKDTFNTFYPVVIKDGYSYIYNYKEINNLELIKEYKSLGINNFRLDFLDETPEEINEILIKIPNNK